MTSVKETKTEARQGDERRMNARALVWGLGGAVAVLVVLWLLWASFTGS